MGDADLSGDAAGPTKPQRLLNGWAIWILCILGFILLCPPWPGGIGHPRDSRWLRASHTIALAAFSYANDHNHKYPDGKSSTEVFQKLIDGKYVDDTTIFYVPMKGKTKPIAGQPLKPENVCWDFTGRTDG